jgi:hypothetical protein
MSDWQVGDKAVCVDAAITPHSVVGEVSKLVVGRIYTVCKLRPTNAGIMRLGLAEFHHADNTHSCFYACRFRKVVQDKHEPCEEEFVTLLNRKRVSA